MTRKGCNQNNVTFLLKLIIDLSRYQIQDSFTIALTKGDLNTVVSSISLLLFYKVDMNIKIGMDWTEPAKVLIWNHQWWVLQYTLGVLQVWGEY